jgi:hypothetical protein
MIQFELGKLPASNGLERQVKNFIDFLQGSTIGNSTLSYECPISKNYIHLHLKRTERPPCTYYREEYPLYFWTTVHNCPSFLLVRVQLEHEDKNSLRDTLLRALQT